LIFVSKAKELLISFLSKKFIYAVLALAAFIVLLAVHLISEETFSTLMCVLIPAYITGDVTQNVFGKKTKEVESGSGAGGQPDDSIGVEK